jgi:hypothetical protein
VAVHSRVDVGSIADLPAGTLAPDHLDVTVRVADAGASQLRWAAARDLAPGIVAIIALFLVRAVLRSVQHGEAFTETNVTRLRLLAVLVLLGVPIAMFVSSLCDSELASTAGLDGRGAVVSLPGGAFLGGMALLVLTEVFTTGTRLQDDLDGTV